MNKQQLAESFVAMMKEAAKDSPPRIDQLRGKDLFLRYLVLHEKADTARTIIGNANIDLSNFLDDYYGMIKWGLIYITSQTAVYQCFMEWRLQASSNITHNI